MRRDELNPMLWVFWMKRIGFLSFGHWSDARYSQVRSGSDALLQSVELAVAAEELGADGAYFRSIRCSHDGGGLELDGA